MQSPAGENQTGATEGGFKVCHVFFRAFILQTLKLELDPLAAISWNMTSLMQRVSVPSTKFSLRKQKCEVPSLCCLWQDSNVYKSTLKILVLTCLGA